MPAVCFGDRTHIRWVIVSLLTDSRQNIIVLHVLYVSYWLHHCSTIQGYIKWNWEVQKSSFHRGLSCKLLFLASGPCKQLIRIASLCIDISMIGSIEGIWTWVLTVHVLINPCRRNATCVALDDCIGHKSFLFSRLGTDRTVPTTLREENGMIHT